MRKHIKIGFCSYHLCRERTRVFKCKYCGDYFCRKHIKPKMVLNLEQVSTAKEPLRSWLEKEYRSKFGHPDFIYTRIAWKRLEAKKKERLARSWEALDKLKEMKEVPPPSIYEPKIEQLPGIQKGHWKPEKIENKISKLFREIRYKTGFSVYRFTKCTIIFLIVLVLMNLFVTGSFNLFDIILRSLGFSFIVYVLSSIYRKTKYKIPWKWIIILVLVVIVARVYSARDFSSFKLLDIFIGIENFTNSLISLSTNFTIGIAETFTSITSRPNTTDIEKAIFTYTNIERKKYGVKELIWDEKLAEIAREHSKDMAQNNFFSHTNLKGEDPTARAIRHGYNVYKSLGGGWYTTGIAENIGKMTTGDVLGVGYVSNNADSIAQAQVKSWMNSPGHRENILNPNYDRMGVGVAYDGLYYISTQNFW